MKQILWFGLGIVFVLLLVVIFLSIGLHIQIIEYQKAEKYCNERYGKNNWIFQEITGTKNFTHYIGQAWECIVIDEKHLVTYS